MKVVGQARGEILGDSPVRIVPSGDKRTTLRVQAQGGDVCYKLDGDSTAVNGFILPKNHILEINISETEIIYMWSATSGECRIVIQDYQSNGH